MTRGLTLTTSLCRWRLPWSRSGSGGALASSLEAEEQPRHSGDSSAEEFLTGSGKMGTLPVALSMLAR